MTRLDIARQRMHNEHLVGAPLSKPEDVVQWLCAVQAQDYGGAKWAIAQRTRGCTGAEVEQAFQRGRIVRTHVMRPTWHFVRPADIRWMLQLTAPRVKAAMAYYDRKLELDAATFGRTSAAIARALQGGKHLTREELSRRLEEAGIAASGQRLGHIMMRAELDAVICSGPRRGMKFTYALLDERAPIAKTRHRDEALAELTQRYFASHGPALLKDFAWWSGLTVADAKAGVEMAKRHLAHEVVDGKTYYFAPSRTTVRVKNPTLHLLPNYDEYLIAYRDHSASFDAALVRDSGPLYDILSNHIVVMNGNVIGGWRRAVNKDVVVVETRLLAPLNEAAKRALRRAVERYGRFLGLPARLVLNGSAGRLASRP